MGIGCPIMEITRPSIHGNLKSAIVALEIPVVHLVMECPQRQNEPVTRHHALKAGVGCCRRQCEVLEVKYDQQGRRWHDPVDQDCAQIDQMLKRVHGQAGPWPDIGIAVMQGVYPLIEWWPVDEPVNHKKVKGLPRGQQEDEQD